MRATTPKKIKAALHTGDRGGEGGNKDARSQRVEGIQRTAGLVVLLQLLVLTLEFVLADTTPMEAGVRTPNPRHFAPGGKMRRGTEQGCEEERVWGDSPLVSPSCISSCSLSSLPLPLLPPGLSYELFSTDSPVPWEASSSI